MAPRPVTPPSTDRSDSPDTRQRRCSAGSPRPAIADAPYQPPRKRPAGPGRLSPIGLSEGVGSCQAVDWGWSASERPNRDDAGALIQPLLAGAVLVVGACRHSRRGSWGRVDRPGRVCSPCSSSTSGARAWRRGHLFAPTNQGWGHGGFRHTGPDGPNHIRDHANMLGVGPISGSRPVPVDPAVTPRRPSRAAVGGNGSRRRAARSRRA